MSSSAPGRRRRLLAGVAVAALALVPAVATVGGVAQAAPEIKPKVKISRSELRPGESATFTYASPAGNVFCYDLTVAQICFGIGSPVPSFGQTATFDEFAQAMLTFGGSLVLKASIYRGSDCTEGDLGFSCDGDPLASDSIRLIPIGEPRVKSLTRGPGKVRAVGIPGADYGKAIKSYQTRCVEKGRTVYTSEVSSTPRTVVRVPSGLTVLCSTRAKNAYGWSNWSRAKRIVASNMPPLVSGAPTLVSATAGPQQATVVLERPAQRHGATITAYQVQCVNGDTARTSTVSKAKTHVVTGLTAGEEWDCSGRARNSVGWSPWSDVETVTPSPLPN